MTAWLASFAGAFLKGNRGDIELDLEEYAIVHLKEKVGKGILGIGDTVCKEMKALGRSMVYSVIVAAGDTQWDRFN